MERIGQSKPIFVSREKELTGSFIVSEKYHISNPSMPSVQDPVYSYTECMTSYVATTAGCHLDWVRSIAVETAQPCTTVHQILAYQEELLSVNRMQWKKLKEKTGCLPKCNVMEFSFVEKNQEDVTWRYNWSSSFFLSTERTLIRREEELLAIDFEDMINGIGGALGLFLGWSILNMVSDMFDMAITVTL